MGTLRTAIITAFIFSIYFQQAHCDTYQLYNTKEKTSDLKWTSTGWEEMSGFDSRDGGVVIRYYEVCNSDKDNQDNWIRSPFIDARGATRIHVEIEFSIKKCDTLGPEHAKYCRETFNLYYYESASDVASSTFPPWREKPYKKVDTVAANSNNKVNKKTFTIGPLTRKGLYIAAQDQGACMSLNSMKVYYYLCPETEEKLVTFPSTISGAEMTSLVPVQGRCVANAQRINPDEVPTYHCGGEGAWRIQTGGCRCNPGYKSDELGTMCIPCKPGTFKFDASSEDCVPCPFNSGNGDFGATDDASGPTYCPCLDGFFRAEDESKASACTKPPTEPTNVKAKANSTGALIHWSEPLDLGGRVDIIYSVNCFECTSESFNTCRQCSPSVKMLQLRPMGEGGEVSLSGLKPFTPYLLKVSSMNGVSKVSGEPHKTAEVKIFTLEAVPSIITNIYVAKRMERGVEIKWRPPLHPNGIIQAYEVETRLADGGSMPGAPAAPILKETQQTTVQITELEPNRDYVVRIRAKNSAGFGHYSEMVQFSTMPGTVDESPPQEFNHVIVIAVVVVAVIIFALVVIIFVYLQSKGRILLPGSKQKTTQNGHGTSHEKDSLIGPRIYVEYPDPRQAVQSLNRELDPKDITVLEKLIGEGEFAQVLHGKLSKDGTTLRVAVKQLKQGASVKDQSNFLREACSMAQFDHPNILQLKGVITKSRPVMLISEYMENGALDEFLTKHQSELDAMQLTKMLHGIASGMRYLSEIQYVHRDLAARNILVNSDLVCKVSDFGLSRTLENDPHATYTTQGGKIAIRWAAPECIRYRQFTSASDVWSFGIVMWEVMSYGEKPYWDMTNQEVVQNIENGMRLPAPTICPQVLHDKMLECWSLDPKNRPNFAKIVSDLDILKKTPKMLGINGETGNGNIPANNSTSTLAAACATPNLQHALNHGEITSVEEWLKCQKLDKYKDRFLAHGLDTLDKVSNLTIKDLRSLGIDVTLHVHKLENGIRSLRRHLSTSSSRPSSSLCADDMEQGEDDVIVSPTDDQVSAKAVRNGSFRLPATQEETAILIPEGSVAV